MQSEPSDGGVEVEVGSWEEARGPGLFTHLPPARFLHVLFGLDGLPPILTHIRTIFPWTPAGTDSSASRCSASQSSPRHSWCAPLVRTQERLSPLASRQHPSRGHPSGWWGRSVSGGSVTRAGLGVVASRTVTTGSLLATRTRAWEAHSRQRGCGSDRSLQPALEGGGRNGLWAEHGLCSSLRNAGKKGRCVLSLDRKI